MSVYSSSSDGETDVDDHQTLSRAPTFLDTESDGDQGPDHTAGIDLPTLLEHVDLPLCTHDQRTPQGESSDHLARADAPSDVSHAGLLRTAMRESNLLDVVNARRRISRKGPYDSKVLGTLFENPSNTRQPVYHDPCTKVGSQSSAIGTSVTTRSRGKRDASAPLRSGRNFPFSTSIIGT